MCSVIVDSARTGFIHHDGIRVSRRLHGGRVRVELQQRYYWCWPCHVTRCYPSRGSEEMAIELARVINDNGG